MPAADTSKVGNRSCQSAFRSVAVAVGMTIGYVSSAAAQADPSSVLLLNPRPSAEAPAQRPQSNESGRYQIRPRPTAPSRPVIRATPTPPPVEVDREEDGASRDIMAAPEAKPDSLSPGQDLPSGQRPETPQPEKPASPDTTPSGRANLIEISALPSFIYIDQRSNFAPKNWVSASPGGELRVRTWLNDTTGLHAAFFTTLGASVTDGLSSDRLVPLTASRFLAGLSHRGRYSWSGLPASFVGRIEFIENQIRVPQTSQFRQRTTTTGFSVAGEAEIGVTRERSLRLEMVFAPRLKNEEMDTDRVGGSGSSPDTHLIAGAIGYRWRLDSTLAVDLRLQHSYERSLFGATSTRPDPISGQVLNGVSSDQSISLIQLGFEWGN